MKIPVIDLGTCTECEGCIEVCPSVFRKNQATGYIEIVDLENYPEEEVNEAIKDCPADSIHWE